MPNVGRYTWPLILSYDLSWSSHKATLNLRPGCGILYYKPRKTQFDLFWYPYDRKWKKRSSLSRFHCGKKRGSPIPTWYVKSNWLIRGTSNSIDYVTPHYYKRAAAFYYTKMGFGTPSAITRIIIIVKGQSNLWLRQRLVSLEFNGCNSYLFILIKACPWLLSSHSFFFPLI